MHRSAWRPADLPFHPDHRPDMEESWTSSFTAEAYGRVQATGLYQVYRKAGFAPFVRGLRLIRRS